MDGGCSNNNHSARGAKRRSPDGHDDATGVDDASNPPRTIESMPSAPATGFVTSSRVDQGVAWNGRQPPEGRPPAVTAAAPQLSVEQLLQLVIMEGVAMNSKLERLEKENLDLKTERTSLMSKLGNQRRYLKEVQAVHKQRLDASNEAAKASEDRAKQLAETVDSLSKQLEDAMKDLKAAEDTLKASSRVPRRRINYDKPSRWTLATDVNKLTEYFTELFGPDWLNFDATGEGGGEESADPGKAAYPTKVLGAFLRKHAKNLEMEGMLSGSVMRKIEEGIVECIAKHFDEIAADLFIHAGLSTREYQKVVNLISSVQKDLRLVRARLPYGTGFPKLASLAVISKRLHDLMASLGLDKGIPKAAMSDAKALLTSRIRWLVANGRDFIIPGTDNQVQVQLLGDACGIFKKNKVQGTSLVLKTIYNNSGGDADAHVDEILHKCGVNSVENCCLLGFFLGDDKYMDIVEKIPQLAAVVSELMSDEGLEVDGVKYTFKVTFGGDLKFLNSILGLNGCSSSFPCIYCKVLRALLHLKTSERYETVGSQTVDHMEPRTLAEQIQLAHTPSGQSTDQQNSCASGFVAGEGCASYVCPGCSKSIGPGHKELNRLPLPRKAKPGPDDYGVAARSKVNQQHFGTMLRPMLDLPIMHYVFDILHCRLRIVPQIFKWTVCQNIDAEQLEEILVWAQEVMKVKLNAGTQPGQRRAGSKGGSSLSTESWPGEICSTLMDFHEELMNQVFEDQGSAVCQWSKHLWRTFSYWNHLIGRGCEDDQPSRDAHAAEVKKYAEMFMSAFLMRCGPEHVTVYMHIMQCHCHELIQLHGSLDKFCSQGAEAIHQKTRHVALKRSDRHVEHLAEQVLVKVRTYQDLVAEKGQPQNYRAPRQLRDGRSKACAERNAAMIQGCKEYLDNLPPDHDEILRRGLLAEGSRLSEDETPDTEKRDHDMDSSDSEIDDEDENRYKTNKGPSYAP